MPTHARRPAALLACASLAALGACEPSSARVTPRAEAAALGRVAFIGTEITMGAAAGGVVNGSQVVSWPAILAASVGVTLTQPLFAPPGCAPPLVTPLLLGLRLSTNPADPRDTTCAGAATTATPPTDNLALAGATAWAALNLSPRLILAAPTSFDPVTRAQYPLVLGNPQTQVTAMLVRAPTFVAVELGAAEVMPAALSGRLVAATSYTQTGPWTYVPAAVAAPVLAAIADSVAKSGARAVWLTAPHVTRLPAFRTGAALAAERATLAMFGVQLADDCTSSPNLVAVAKVTTAATRAATSGATQSVSCADVPGAADQVLTPADVQLLDGVVDAINAQVRQLAAAHGWAVADLDAAFVTGGLAGVFPVTAALTCDRPYGYLVSADGVTPSVDGQRAIAAAVASAVNATYKLAFPTAAPSIAALPAIPCF